MATYAVTFRIGDVTVGGQSYQDRRTRLIENVRKENGGYWEETTSFFFVESSLNTPQFGARAVGGLSASHDMVVLFDPQDMSACYFGNIKHTDVLLSFLPSAKKLG